MQAHLDSANATAGRSCLLHHPLGLLLTAGLPVLAGLLSGATFVALIHAPLPEELVLASLGHEAATAAVGRQTNP